MKCVELTIDDTILIHLVVELEAITMDEIWGQKGLVEHLDQGGVLLALMDGSSCVGFVVARGVLGEWELYKIAVHPAYRQKGYGIELLKALELRVEEKLFLEVRQSNSAAQQLYIKHCFKQIGVRKNYYKDGEDALLFQKEYRITEPF